MQASAPDPETPETTPPDVEAPTPRIVLVFRSISTAVQSVLQSLGWAGKGRHLVVAILIAAWVVSGVYRVNPNQQGVVLRFGKWVETTGPGLHYHLPFPVETVLEPAVTQVHQLILGVMNKAPAGTPTIIIPLPSIGGAPAIGLSQTDVAYQMLTGDENVVLANYTIFWRIKSAKDYLFNIQDPVQTVSLAAQSAMHQIISQYPIQAALSDKRMEIAQKAQDLTQQILDGYHAGILILQVQLQRVDPPSAVIDAFNDVQRAKADQVRSRNNAEAYANSILPQARGQAVRIVQDAEAYQAQVVNTAQGEAQRFLAVYNAYKQAKDVTAWRMYLDSMDQLLKKSGKVIVDTSGKGLGSVVPYMPVAPSRLPGNAAGQTAPAVANGSGSGSGGGQ